MASVLEELQRLQEDADVLMQQTERVNERLVPVKAQDDTGEVVVSLDELGRVTSVQVGFAWDRSLSPAELPGAVMGALAEAQMKRFELWGDSMREQEAVARPRARPVDTTGSPLATLRAQVDEATNPSAQAERQLREILTDVVVALREADQVLEDHAGRTHVGRSTSGHVRAFAASGSAITSVEFDQTWLARAHPANLGREITQAIQAAARTSERDGIEAALKATKLGRLAANAFAARPPAIEKDL